MTILAVLGLASTAGATVTGSVRLDGEELIGLDARRLRAIRGTRPVGPIRAVEGVSLNMRQGPFGIALVGESGSGKSTVGRAILRTVTDHPARRSPVGHRATEVLSGLI